MSIGVVRYIITPLRVNATSLLPSRVCLNTLNNPYRVEVSGNAENLGAIYLPEDGITSRQLRRVRLHQSLPLMDDTGASFWVSGQDLSNSLTRRCRGNRFRKILASLSTYSLYPVNQSSSLSSSPPLSVSTSSSPSAAAADSSS